MSKICSHYRCKPKLFAMLSIGQLAAETGVNVETIWYYERVGLLAAPQRTQGRHRAYGEQYVQWLTFSVVAGSSASLLMTSSDHLILAALSLRAGAAAH
jgi:hypothetical protein